MKRKRIKNKYHRCYKLPNNKLTNYTKLINNGIINFNDTLTHKINLEISDYFNNISSFNFKVKSTNNPFLLRCPLPKDTIKTSFKFNEENILQKNNINLHMQPFSLYEPIMFNYNVTESAEGVYGEVHHLHYNTVPVHKKYTLAIKANLPENLKRKAYIATTDMKGHFWYIGGKWNNGYLKTKTKVFGDFCIVVDTIKPEIRGLNIFPEKVLNSQQTIKLIIKDKESGIKSFRGEIDGKWILLDYDHKQNLVRFDIDNNIIKGEHIFTLKVIDNVGNTAKYEAKFTY